VANRTRREVDGLADLKLVFLQRSSPNLERHDFALLERCFPPIAANIAAKSSIASKIPLFGRDCFQPHQHTESQYYQLLMRLS
jgi:hypothetical protein